MNISILEVFLCIYLLFYVWHFCLGVFAGVKLLVFKTKRIENLHIFLILFSFCCGAALGIYHDHKTFSRVYPLYGRDISICGNVYKATDENFAIKTEYGNIMVYNYIGASVEKGDKVMVSGNFSGYEAAQYRGDFDNRLNNALSGIVGRITCDYVEVTGHKTSFSLWDSGAFVREKIESKIKSFDVSHKCKGFVTALLTGSTDELDNNVKNMFRTTGTSHVTAVSGLHVGIFLSFFILISRGMGRNKVVHLLFVFVLVSLYTILIGERASVFRAGIMTVASYMMFAVKRRSDPLMNLMVAGIFICLINPYYVISPGFQMSFLATLGLVLFAGNFKYQVIAVPLIATLFMLPVTLYYYNTISVTTVFANIIIVFLVPFVVLTGYVGCFISPFLYISFALAQLIIIVSEFFSSLKILHFTLPSPDMMQFVMHFFLVCGAYLYFLKKKPGDFWLILAFICVVFLNGLFNNGENAESVSVRFINGGNYNMQHITTENGYEIFVDCINMASEYVIKNNVGNIYAVVITDTSPTRLQGLEALCSTNSVRYVILPRSPETENLKLEKCEVLYYNQDGYIFETDGVKFNFTKINDERCLLVGIYEEIIGIPFDETISELYGSRVLCVPDKCTDCLQATVMDCADYYIHATYRYDYYDHGEKYITAQEGMINIIFEKGFKPKIKKY